MLFLKKRKEKKDEKAKNQNAVPKKDGRPMFETLVITLLQNKVGVSHQQDKPYVKCPDDGRTTKLYSLGSPFTNAMQPMMSNKIYGEPPDTMEAINPLILQRLLRLQQSTTFQGFQ